ncbi:MAG TPA: GNAT family N-acetyltransferase [Ktedonobacterales bacterium]|nr:GNAT family N-acetyltransferase [Ktedonobacterales bacterium]
MTMDPSVALVAPDARYAAAFRALLADYHAVGELFFSMGTEARIAQGFAAYLAHLAALARGEGLSPGVVPETMYWLVRDDVEVLGASRLRHRLTPALEDAGGHIGYSIRPSARGQGYGTLQLALTLERARALGLARVLLTCDSANVASARVIERNGGELASQGYSAITGTEVSRYWIAL